MIQKNIIFYTLIFINGGQYEYKNYKRIFRQSENQSC